MKKAISTTSLGAILCLTMGGVLLNACVAAPESTDEEGVAQPDGTEEVAEVSSAATTLTLPSFSGNPNIAAAASQYLSPQAAVRAIVTAESGLQVYQCALNAAQVPTWTLRTPLAHLKPDADSLAWLQSPSPGVIRQLTRAYHYRSDFGGLLSQTALTQLGLTNPPANVPVWDFSFSTGATSSQREIVAGRVLAQDVVGTGNIANFFIEVRGRAVFTSNVLGDEGSVAAVDPVANGIAASEYMLRWNTTGGVAMGSCTAGNLGAEAQVPYKTQYYFIDNNPPPPQNELHLIGVYEANSNHSLTGAATVNVERQGNVILALSSYESVHWTVNVAPGVNLQKVILNGYEGQTATVPAGVPVETRAYLTTGNWLGSCAYSWPGSSNGCNSTLVGSNLESLTGRKLKSFNGCYRSTSFTLRNNLSVDAACASGYPLSSQVF